MRPTVRFTAIERARLRQRFSLPDATVEPLTLMLAPAGYGKTVGTLKWLESTGLPEDRVFWVTARREWEGPGELWRALFDELTARARDADRPAKRHREEVERILSRTSEPTVLVIDSYQFVTEAQLDLDVAHLAELSDHLFLTVLSRRFSALDGPIVTSRVPTAVVTTDDLAFSHDEVERLADLYGVGGGLVGSIADETRGWPLAVQGMLSAAAAGTVELSQQNSRFADAAVQMVADSRGVQALLAAALCENITVEMVGGLTELPTRDAAKLMRDLEDLGLVTRSWFPERVRFKCHEGLARVLRARAVEEFGEVRAGYLRRSHALGLSSEDPAAALRALCELGEFESAERIMLRHFDGFISAGRETLALLRTLATDDIEDYFPLVGARLFLEIGDPSAPAGTIERWYELLQRSTHRRLLSGDTEHLVGALAMLMSAERMRGDGPESQRLARDLEKRLTDTSDRNLSSVRPSLSMVYSVLAFTGLMNGDFEMSRRAFGQARDLAEAAGTIGARLRALNGLALTAAVAGHNGEARQHLDAAEALHRATGVPAPDMSGVNGVIAQALLAADQGEGASALAPLEAVQLMMHRMDQWVLFLCAEAMAVRIDQGNREALLLLQRRCATAEFGVRPVPHQQSVLAAYTASLLMVTGDFASAEQQLAPLPDDHPAVAVARARLSLMLGDHREALRRASRARSMNLGPRGTIEACLIAAIAHWEFGAPHDAFAALRQGVDLMRAAGGGIGYFGMIPYESLVELAGAARDAGVVDVVDDLARVPDTLRCLQFEPLTRAELRTLQALRSGEPLRATADSLFLTQNTVKSHLRSIYRKLKVSGRGEAIQRGLQIGLISSGE